MNNTIPAGSFTQGFSFSYSANSAGPPGNAGNSGEASQVSSRERADSAGSNRVSKQFLQKRVRGNQRRKLQSQGKKLLNFRLFSGGLESVPEGSESPSMNALIVAGSEDGPNDLEFKLLNVTTNGGAREIYSSNNMGEMGKRLNELGLDSRGMLLDRKI